METKAALRERCLALRAAMPHDERARLSAAIAERLFCLDAYQAAETVFAYASFGAEAETRGIIAHALAMGKRVCLPVLTGRVMDFAPFVSWVLCTKNRYGIPEPRKDVVLPDARTILLAPGAAFGRDGHRIGYGGAYYDRYMVGKAFALTVGLAFSCQITDSLPAEPHDIRLDGFITDNETRLLV